MVGLIDNLRFYVPLKNFSYIWRLHNCRWRATKFRPMLGAQGLWAGVDLYRVTPAVTRDICFSGLTAQISRLLRHMRGMWRNYYNLDPHRELMVGGLLQDTVRPMGNMLHLTVVSILVWTTGNPIYLISTEGAPWVWLVSRECLLQQRMLTPPSHLIQPSHCWGVRVVPHWYSYVLFWDCDLL
jgi:hypothetical protein